MIKSFEEYVEKFCPDVSVDQAKQFAKKGQELLIYINNDVKAHPKNDQDLRDQTAYLQWYLVKSSFDSGKNFGKGIFVIEMENDLKTQRLYEYLRNGRESIYSPQTITDEKQRTQESLEMTAKGLKSGGKISKKDKNPTYSRTSSHFNPLIENSNQGHFGIDSDGKVPLPLSFKTSAFGKLKDGVIYLKPETEGADVLRDPKGSAVHGINLVKTIAFGGETIEGLGRFAEAHDGNDYGNAVQVKFTGLQLKVKGGHIKFQDEPMKENKPKDSNAGYNPLDLSPPSKTFICRDMKRKESLRDISRISKVIEQPENTDRSSKKLGNK